MVVRPLVHAEGVVRDGDDLLLRRGDTFDDTFGMHKWSNVTISAYGNGDRPTVAVDTSAAYGLLILNGRNDRVVGVHLTAAHRDPSKPDFRLVDGKAAIA